MTADTILGLAWLVLAHLVADFALQTGRIVRAKSGDGGRALGGLLVHGAVVGLCLVPLGFAFGPTGWWAIAAVVVSHVLVDRAKIVLSARAESGAREEARRRHEATSGEEAGLGPAWTPLPAAFFALDQVAHVAVLAGIWVGLLSTSPLEPAFRDAATTWFAAWDPATVHSTITRTVVAAALVIVNVRAGALFVAVLVGPRLEAARGLPSSASAEDRAAGTPRGWTLRFGPLVGRVDADREPVAAAAVAHHTPARPARVGEAIGILERLLVVTLVLVRAEAAIGLVIAAKTLARFRQLDDRDFAEYYLLGTLASVAVAVISAFAALAILDTLP